MIKHYLKIAFRNLWKYKTQNLIGVIGLSIGICFFTLGYHWMKYETSYDKFHPNSDRIYRVYAIDKNTQKPLEHLPMALADKLTQEFPEVENVSMYFNQYPYRVYWGEADLGTPEFRFVDEHFFEFFPPTIIAGETNVLLQSDEDLIVTEDYARKYWGSPEEAVGQVLEVNAPKSTLTITAVMANLPQNSNFQGEGFRQDPFERKNKHKARADRIWLLKDVNIYILLNKGIDVEAFQNKLRSYLIDNGYNEDWELYITNIADMRHTLGSDLSFNINYIRTFVGAGLLLMFCALFNFLNLYVNRMLQRKREMKLRKTVGAKNFSIIKLFQTELLIQLLFVFLLGGILLIYIVPLFEQRFETVIFRPKLQTQYWIIIALTFAILFAFCLFSEWKFARFSTLTYVSKTNNYKFLRNISICVQLAVCVFFIVSAVVFYKQVNMMNHFDWGFNKEGLIKISTTYGMKNNEIVNQEIANLPLVKSFVNTGDFELRKEPYFMDDYTTVDGVEIKEPILTFNFGDDILDVFGIPLLQGRSFEEQDDLQIGYADGVMVSISNKKVLITESLYKLIGKEDIIGQVIFVPEYSWSNDRSAAIGKREVVGVVKDFQVTGLQNQTYPIIITRLPSNGKWRYSNNYIRVEEGREQEAIAAIKDIFDKYSSGDPSEIPEIIPVNDILNNINKSENASLQLFLLLALLCVVIAVFGIYSISYSNVERRKREVAIRKVSGATVSQIVRMFLAEYSKLLIVANLIALPLAYYYMQDWLSSYTYKISIDLWLFFAVFVFTLFIVILTVLVQIIRAANANLLDVIKSQ
ncbi:putative ABC transport system permease protein [Dysgonomonadaceae bacterium PH5-43]|nr:putative ABC transport system permease protein [Dysgonomonadaceae bacterium PH5-43]